VSKQHHSPVTKPGRGRRRLGTSFVVALVIHVELLLLFGLGAYIFLSRDADVQARLAASKQPESIDIGMVDEDVARRILADLERSQEEQKAKEIEKEVDSIRAPGQVVDVPAPLEEKRPDDARFASEHDTTVDKQTRKYGKFDPEARQGDPGGKEVENKPDRKAEPVPPVLAMRTPRMVPGTKRGPLEGAQGGEAGAENGAPDPGDPDPEGGVSPLGRMRRQPGSAGGAAGAPALVPLMPSTAQLARAIGSGTHDALKDIDDGDETALNSKKWRFASFFNRVKRQVQEHWHPEEVYRRRDPSGAVYGRADRITIVRVKLKPDGNLADLELESPSGLEFLDDEALQAFRAAQPFPNPPRQLIERDGLINFRFGFLFELSGVSRPFYFKYNM
jgi:TonB family protein